MVLGYRSRLARERYNGVGLILRGARCGFGYSERHDAFIRMSWIDESKGLIKIISCPPQQLAGQTKGKIQRERGLYIHWFGNRDSVNLVSSSLPFTRADTENYRVFTADISGDKIRLVSQS